MRSFIKHMSGRCKELLRDELAAIGFNYTIAELETQDLLGIAPDVKYEVLERAYAKCEAETVHTRRSDLFAQLKVVVVRSMQDPGVPHHMKYSAYLSDTLKHNYTYLSNLFTQMEGSTLGRYIIEQRIERAKQLLVLDELPLSQIAWQLQYSSVSHLSNQFKKVTGVCPSTFKSQAQSRLPAPGVLCEPCRQVWTGLLQHDVAPRVGR